MNDVIFSILLVILGLFVGIIIMIILNYIKTNISGKKAESIIDKANKEADKIKRNYLLDAKEEAHKLKIDFEKEMKEKKNEIKESEERLLLRESNIDKRDQTLQNREQMLEERENNLVNKQREIQKEQDKVEEIKKEQVDLLEKIAGYSKNEARELVMKKVEEMMNLEIAAYIKDREVEAKLEVDKKAKSLLISSMQKYAGDVAGDQTVTVVNLPNDDMKGRLIGREGRNIRSIEAVTGVDLIIDDTPEAIVLSSFDPYRREIARVAVEALIKDGRIHPGRIEEIYKKISSEFNSTLRKIGEQTCQKLGIVRINKEMYDYIGRLKYRTSYGQNALDHSIQVAYLCGIMAAELGLDVNLAKRAGLLHDIGKAADFELEGSHVEVGARICKKYNEPDVVINGIESHHGDKPMKYLISNIVQAADTLSAARPGARSETLENYIQRIEKIEDICKSFEGVSNCYAMQSGREVRVSVIPERVSDEQTVILAQQIKTKLEQEATYPGQIKVNVIREWRATEIAK